MMNTIHDSISFFESYFRGEVDMMLGFEPYIFMLTNKVLRGDALSEFEKTRILTYFNQGFSFYFKEHYAWMSAIALKLCTPSPILRPNFDSLEFLALWNHDTSVIKNWLDSTTQSSFLDRITYETCALPASMMDKHLVQLLCNRMAYIYTHDDNVLNAIVKATLPSSHFIVPSDISEYKRQKIQQCIRQTPSFEHSLKNIYTLNFFTHKNIGQNEESNHPLMLLGLTEHDVWVYVFIQYAKLRCRDSWIYHMDDGDLCKKFNSRYDVFVGHRKRIECRQRWYKQWEDSCKNYIQNLNAQQKDIYHFILRHFNPGTKKWDFCTPESIGFNPSLLVDRDFKDMQNKLTMHQTLTEEAPESIIASWLKNPPSLILSEEPLML